MIALDCFTAVLIAALLYFGIQELFDAHLDLPTWAHVVAFGILYLVLYALIGEFVAPLLSSAS